MKTYALYPWIITLTSLYFVKIILKQILEGHLLPGQHINNRKETQKQITF